PDWPSPVLASARITSIDSRSVASVTGLPLITRTAESPRPMPQTVRLPNMSLSVANSDAVTVQSRVAGLVTIGPTVIRCVTARSTPRQAGGSFCSTTPKSTWPSDQVLRQRALDELPVGLRPDVTGVVD